MPQSGFEFISESDDGVVSIIRFYSQSLFQRFCDQHLQLKSRNLRSLNFGWLEGDNTREEILILAHDKFPEIHIHGGKANREFASSLLDKLEDDHNPHENPLLLWEKVYACVRGECGIAYLQEVLAGSPHDMQGSSYELEGYEFLRPVTISLIGPPNAGKSTLFNAMIGESRALTSPISGTTRDLIKANTVLAGHDVILVDCAGLSLQETEDPKASAVIKDAQKLSQQMVQDSDLLIDLNPTITTKEVPSLLVKSKIDLNETNGAAALKVSGKTGEGLNVLMDQLKSMVTSLKKGRVSPRFHSSLKSAQRIEIDSPLT